MTEDPILLHQSATSAVAVSVMTRQTHGDHNVAPTCFDRRELHPILTIYGHMVAAGEWRDYALDFLPDVAVFSVFRRASEIALFRIEKQPKLRNRQGQYAVVAMGGLVMKRGHDLAQVLKVFDKALVKARA
jgi:hypothetical protein